MSNYTATHVNTREPTAGCPSTSTPQSQVADTSIHQSQTAGSWGKWTFLFENKETIPGSPPQPPSCRIFWALISAHVYPGKRNGLPRLAWTRFIPVGSFCSGWVPEQNPGSVGKDPGWLDGRLNRQSLSEKFPSSQSERASPVPALHSFLCRSNQRVECDNVFAQGPDFLRRIGCQQRIFLC